MTSRSGTWRNWSGSVRCSPASWERPADVGAIRDLVRHAKRDGMRIRVAGSGHSFSPLVATDDVLVTLDRMQGIVSLDTARREVTVRAGTTLRALGRDLHAAGFALENLGGVDVQTVAGAIGTGTHGSGLGFGSMATQVTGMTLVTGDGSVVEASAGKDPDLLHAASLSLGALGIIVSVTLRVVPAHRLRLQTGRQRIARCRESLVEDAHAHQHFELFWFPHTEWAQTRTLDPAPFDARPGHRIRRAVSDVALENGAVWALSQACRLTPALVPRVSAIFAAGASEMSGVDWSHRLLVSPRLVRMEAMEYALPLDEGRAALEEIERALFDLRLPVHVPLGIRFVPGDDVWLSPAYQRDSVYIAAHAFRGTPFESYFKTIERILQAHGGRPHWGKWHSLEAGSLAHLYPRWEDFQRLREALDPGGTFLNDYLEKLLAARPVAKIRP